jgi:hypothetical protein
VRLLFGIPVHADQRHVGTLRGVTSDLPHSQGVCQRGVNSRDVPPAVSAVRADDQQLQILHALSPSASESYRIFL